MSGNSNFFTDEAWFRRIVFVNSQNMRLWTTNNLNTLLAFLFPSDKIRTEQQLVQEEQLRLYFCM
jgi:hypothetical protein